MYPPVAEMATAPTADQASQCGRAISTRLGGGGRFGFNY
jgi:hypothetical protein